MDQIILEDFDDLRNPYYWSDEPDFAFCSKEKNGKAQLLTQFAYCRETVAGDLFAKISGTTNHRRESFVNLIKQIPSDKTCVAFRMILGADSYDAQWNKPRYKKNLKALNDVDEKFNKAVEAAIHMLNLIENKYGWGLTKAKMVKNVIRNGVIVRPGDQPNTKMKIAYFTADKKWIRSPHVLSLFLLLIRISITARKASSSILKIKTFEKLIEDLKIMRCRWEDGEYIRTAAKFIPIIFQNFDEIFGRSMARNFNPDSYKEVYDSYWGDYSSYVTEGICALCEGKSTNFKVSKAFALASKDPKVVMKVAATAETFRKQENDDW